MGIKRFPPRVAPVEVKYKPSGRRSTGTDRQPLFGSQLTVFVSIEYNPCGIFPVKVERLNAELTSDSRVRKRQSPTKQASQQRSNESAGSLMTPFGICAKPFDGSI